MSTTLSTPRPAGTEDMRVMDRITVTARSDFQRLREEVYDGTAHPVAARIVLAGEEAFIDAALERFWDAIARPDPVVPAQTLAPRLLGHERAVLALA